MWQTCDYRNSLSDSWKAKGLRFFMKPTVWDSSFSLFTLFIIHLPCMRQIYVYSNLLICFMKKPRVWVICSLSCLNFCSLSSSKELRSLQHAYVCSSSIARNQTTKPGCPSHLCLTKLGYFSSLYITSLEELFSCKMHVTEM